MSEMGIFRTTIGVENVAHRVDVVSKQLVDAGPVLAAVECRVPGIGYP
jgi:hypothetical protein